MADSLKLASDLTPGDKVVMDDDSIQVVQSLPGRAMVRGHILINYKSGEWSSCKPDTEVTVKGR